MHRIKINIFLYIYGYVKEKISFLFTLELGLYFALKIGTIRNISEI